MQLYPVIYSLLVTVQNQCLPPHTHTKMSNGVLTPTSTPSLATYQEEISAQPCSSVLQHLAQTCTLAFPLQTK